ncbi:UNVERIFIED_CONTAM: nahG [Trichonephila clavipes]
MEESSKLRVGIVGGGISGAALAVGLCRCAHLDVKLFESAPAFGEVGAGISLGANAIRAISGLGLAKAYHQVADRTPKPWHDVWFEWRDSKDASYIGASMAPGVGQSSVHRADFLSVLAESLAEGVATFSKRVVSVEQANEEVKVLFTDGSSYTGDILIGADGIKSTVRDYVLDGSGSNLVSPHFSGTCAYRGLIDSKSLRDSYRVAGIDEHLVDVPQMYLGLDHHILTFPVKQGRLINVVAFVSDRGTPPMWPKDSPWVCSVSTEEMLKVFSTSGAAIRILLESIQEPTCWALHDLDELPSYVYGQTALIGDAAHAMLPHQGAGAGQGLEDAYLLAKLLTNTNMKKKFVPKVLSTYDSLRRPRASLVQYSSWESGEIYELRHQYVGSSKNDLRRSLANRFDWIWNYNLDEDVTQAIFQLGWEGAAG